ncbi:uncharacterized protein KY384_003701 [Bacidia gigantensis]|uniref:uncharacterized protein n=1 Tax=Bacidia gigantensis TaxID=2732470 RepID=UPI001D052BC3|nr:uncharacterized protein KY384_003701 [Bacidia gigantensis]KAG8532064.1 hypothetical protein KY384_003701 [Bacidia gigantensis]
MSDKRRRKSLSIVKPPLSPLTPINEPSGSQSPVSLLKKRISPKVAPPSPGVSSPTSLHDVPSPSSTAPRQIKHKSSIDRLVQKARPRSLQKSGRPSSLFGSFRGGALSPKDEDDNELSRTSSQPSSIHSQSEFFLGLAASPVLLHGDVQTASGVFRKRSQYLVLTDSYLIKFRSQSRAAEIFPCIPSSMGRASGVRHSRLSSSGSVHEFHAQGEGLQAVPLNQVVAIYRLDDGKPYFSIEVSYLDEEAMQASSVVLQLHDPRDHDLWLSSIQGAAMNARLKDPVQFSQQLVEYTARVLEQDMDYDPHQFHMFRVVQRAGKTGATRSSSDDLTKLTSSVCILAIGVFKLHLIPLPKGQRTLSNTSLSDLNGISHGMAALTEFTVAQDDDSFLLKFRIPLRQNLSLSLASSCVNDIALSTRRTTDFFRPKWPEQPFTWNVPKVMDEDFLEIPPIDEENEALNRTLAAYCAAYGLDASFVRYTVNTECEDGPAFCLAPRADGNKYTLLELIAVVRALRYNESFGTLSFAGVALDDLQRLKDPFGSEHVAWRTRSGEQLKHEEESNTTLLVQEVRALALNSTSLRRLDFSYCLNGDLSSVAGLRDDLGCGICEALFPLCANHATNIDWVVLNGTTLSETDLDYFFSAAIDRSCHFRAIDVGCCALGDRSMNTVLNALSHQSSTMESLDLSGNPARLDPQILCAEIRSFTFLRKVNLSDVPRLSNSEPILSLEILLQWKLEDLRLSRTSLNEESVDALAAYLQSSQSASLRSIDLDECQLSGKDAATLLESSVMSSFPRDLRMNLSSNRLEHGHDALVEAIHHSKCPSQLILRMIDYQNEHNYQRLLDAVSVNIGLSYLDISQVTLPSDANIATCEALGRLFVSNNSLTFLDISGEQTHLVASSLGIGLNSALLGLKHNNTLQVLRIENQRLGLQGASTLASVLEENHSLSEIHCESNEITLQAFTVLVNSLERNETLMYLSDMEIDRAWALRKVDREAESLQDSAKAGSGAMSSTKATVKRTLGKTLSGQKADHKRVPSSSVPHADLQAALGSLSDQWDKEIARLQEYLARNYSLKEGLPLKSPGPLDFDRPGTSDSLETAIRDFSMEKTPRAEVDRQLEAPLVDGKEWDPFEGSEDDAEDAESPLELRKQ